MVLQFPGEQERRRRRNEEQRAAPAAMKRFECSAGRAALAAACAQLVAIERSAAVLASALPKGKKKSPGRGGPGDRGLNRAWAARSAHSSREPSAVHGEFAMFVNKAVGNRCIGSVCGP